LYSLQLPPVTVLEAYDLLSEGEVNFVTIDAPTDGARFELQSDPSQDWVSVGYPVSLSLTDRPEPLLILGTDPGEIGIDAETLDELLAGIQETNKARECEIGILDNRKSREPLHSPEETIVIAGPC